MERSRELTLCMLNIERAKGGLPPLRSEPRLEQSPVEIVDGWMQHENAPPGATCATSFGGPPATAP